MIVCICKLVTDRQVKSAIAEGASTVAEVARACQAGTGCGACTEQIQEMIDCSRCRCDHPQLKVLSPYLEPGRAA
jgi:bacterioferritin-associated ferredoxin